jgi:hypothetical protein
MTTIARHRSEAVAIDLVGTVMMARVVRPRLTLRLADGREITAPFSPDDTAIVTEALRDHATRGLRVRGQGCVTADGRVTRVTRTEEVTLVAPPMHTSLERPPLWHLIEAIGASISPEEWATIPADAGSHLDHYLYGTPKR